MVSVASIVAVSEESTSVVTLLHKQSHDFRPLPSPQLSPSEMHVDGETIMMAAWLTWTYIENGPGMELSYAEAVHESNSWGVCMRSLATYMYRASMFTMGW